MRECGILVCVGHRPDGRVSCDHHLTAEGQEGALTPVEEMLAACPSKPHLGGSEHTAPGRWPRQSGAPPGPGFQAGIKAALGVEALPVKSESFMNSLISLALGSRSPLKYFLEINRKPTWSDKPGSENFPGYIFSAAEVGPLWE